MATENPPDFGRTVLGVPEQGVRVPEQDDPSSTPKASVEPAITPEAAVEPAIEDDAAALLPVESPQPQLSKGRTMLGLAPGVADSVREAVERARASGPEPAPKPLNPKHTLIGLSSNPPRNGPSAAEQKVEGAPAMPASAKGPAAGRTMLGVPSAAAAEVQEMMQAARQGAATRGRPSMQSVPEPPAQARGVVTWAVIAALALAAAVAAFLLFQEPPPPNVQVSIVAADVGDAMLFRAPDAVPGAQIGFGDQQQLLVDGEARFPLSVDSLSLGENGVDAKLIGADGEVQQIRVTLNLDYRVYADPAPLLRGEKFLDVVVAAVAGTGVQLDGEPVALDSQGKAVRKYPIDAAKQGTTGAIEHVVRYRIAPPGASVVEDELRTRLPVTSMRLDSPGFELTTDQRSLEISGLVAQGTRVTLADEGLAVDDAGRFSHTLPLPKPGAYSPRLVAHASGRVPFGVTLAIQRVANLRRAAAAFGADLKLTFAQIAKAPGSHRGAKVAYEGRVFRAKTEGGRTVMQMLVRECPKGMQCSLWVTYPAVTEIAPDSWVRVVGTVDGMQQFRAQSGEVASVPRLAAAFVMPIGR